MSETIVTKRCSKCKEIKPLSEFHKHSRYKYGVRSCCKDCANQQNVIYGKSDKGKKAKLKYKKSDKGRQSENRYRQSEKSKRRHSRYRKTLKSHVVRMKYEQSDKGKQTRKLYTQSEKSKTYQINYRANRRKLNPNAVKARMSVNNAVKTGKLPRPDDFQCSCGNQAHEYHHHLGYEPEHWFDVIAVCVPCHKNFHTDGRLVRSPIIDQ